MSTNHHSDIGFANSLASATVNLPLGQLDQAITDLQNGEIAFVQIDLGSFVAKEIAGGTIIGDAINITVDTESSTASDNLDTITFDEGNLIYMRIANASRVVTVRNNGGGTGNIRTPSGSDVVLNAVNTILMLVYNGSTWNVINESTSASAPVGATYITQTANGTLTNEQALSSLSTGLMKVTTTTGVISTAVPGTDYTIVRIAVLRDEKSTGTDGGGATATTWNQRNLNTEVYDPTGIVSISSNQFTPIAGTYKLSAKAPAMACNRNRLRLFNVTAGTSVDEGMSCNSAAASGVSSIANITTVFTANGTDIYRIDHYTSSTQATTGLGIANGDGSNEVYLEILLEKIA